MSENQFEISGFEGTGSGQFNPKFQVEGVVPHQIIFLSEN